MSSLPALGGINLHCLFFVQLFLLLVGLRCFLGNIIHGLLEVGNRSFLEHELGLKSIVLLPALL